MSVGAYQDVDAIYALLQVEGQPLREIEPSAVCYAVSDLETVGPWENVKRLFNIDYELHRKATLQRAQENWSCKGSSIPPTPSRPSGGISCAHVRAALL